MPVIVSLLQAQANSTEPATTAAPTTAADFVATRIASWATLPDLTSRCRCCSAFASVKADGADVCRTDMVLNDPSPFWQKRCASPTAAEIEVTVNDQDTFGAEKIGPPP